MRGSFSSRMAGGWPSRTGAQLIDHRQALDHSLKRWVTLTRNPEDDAVPIDNDQVED